MPIYTSVLKLDKPIGTPPHQVEVSVYSSPHGGYIRVSEIDANNGSDATFTSALMSADECRALAREGANKRGNSSRLTQSFHFFSLSRSFLP